MNNHFESGLSISRRFQKSFECISTAMFRNVAVINLDTKKCQECDTNNYQEI